jgi:thymidylate synthase (FAD)
MGRIKRNFRNLMETAETRLCTHAQAEYREFMQKCKDLVTEVDPFLGSLLVPKCQVLGYCNEGETCRFNGVRTKKEVMQVLTLLDQFGGEGVKKHC